MKVRNAASSGRKRKLRDKTPKGTELPKPLKITVSAKAMPEKPGVKITEPARKSELSGKSERNRVPKNKKPKITPTMQTKTENNAQTKTTPTMQTKTENNAQTKTTPTKQTENKETKKPGMPKEQKTKELKERLVAYRKVADIKPELTFWLDDGRIIRNLKELSKALKNMDVRVFESHQGKKDVSYWIRDVIGNAGLAADFASARDKNDAMKILQKFARAEKMAETGKKPENQKISDNNDKSGEDDDLTEIKDEENEFLELQKAIKKIAATPKPKKSRLSLEEREKMLLEKERILEDEEKRINRRLLETARKRHRMVEQREILEREKFEEAIRLEKTAKKYGRNTDGIPKLKVNMQYTENMITQLLDHARKELVNGNPGTAVQLLDDIKKSISIAGATSGPYSRKLEYEIMTLEVDIKLASLHHPQH